MESEHLVIESLVLKVHTIDGLEYKVCIYLEAGAETQTYKRLPQEIAKGVWVDEKTFIPGTAIVRTEIVVGPDAKFPG